MTRPNPLDVAGWARTLLAGSATARWTQDGLPRAHCYCGGRLYHLDTRRGRIAMCDRCTRSALV